MADELAESLENSKVVTVVEWANALARVLPVLRLVIEFKVGESANDRIINLTAPKKLTYLFEGLTT